MTIWNYPVTKEYVKLTFTGNLGISGKNFENLSLQDLSTLYILYIWLHNKADFVMAFVAHVNDKAHGLLVFNVWHFNKDITEHGMGMGK